MDKQANNELIARFMGWSPDDRYEKSGDFHVWTSKESKNAILGCYLNYDSDWNWLMTAIDKVFKSLVGIVVDKSFRLEAKIKESLLKVDIKETWNWVVEYIKWYNENKRTNCVVCGEGYKNPNNDSDTCYKCREK